MMLENIWTPQKRGYVLKSTHKWNISSAASSRCSSMAARLRPSSSRICRSTSPIARQAPTVSSESAAPFRISPPPSESGSPKNRIQSRRTLSGSVPPPSFFEYRSPVTHTDKGFQSPPGLRRKEKGGGGGGKSPLDQATPPRI